LRLLASLRPGKVEARKATLFIDTYLQLDAQEQRLFDERMQRAPAEERQKMQELTTSWKEEGRAEGRTEGRAEGRREALLDVVLRLIAKRLGKVRRAELARVRALPIADLDVLAEDLLDFEKPADLKRWLDGRG
jgi:flagellar biosynthesis/type III secretory pathway protein FliH